MKKFKDDTQKFLQESKPNVYGSIMSVVNNKLKYNCLMDMQTEFDHYILERDFEKDDLKYVAEIFQYCYKEANYRFKKKQFKKRTKK